MWTVWGEEAELKKMTSPAGHASVQQAFNADNFQQKIKIVAAESKNLSQSRIYFSSIILNTFPVQKMLLLREMENQVNVIATLYTFHLSTNHLMQFIHLCYWFGLSIYLLSLSLSSFVYLHVFVCNCSSFQFWDAYRFFFFLFHCRNNLSLFSIWEVWNIFGFNSVFLMLMLHTVKIRELVFQIGWHEIFPMVDLIKHKNNSSSWTFNFNFKCEATYSKNGVNSFVA